MRTYELSHTTPIGNLADQFIVHYDSGWVEKVTGTVLACYAPLGDLVVIVLDVSYILRLIKGISLLPDEPCR